jgi:hypothetical protein
MILNGLDGKWQQIQQTHKAIHNKKIRKQPFKALTPPKLL